MGLWQELGPLEAHGFVHETLGVLLDTALSVVRHAVAAEPMKELMVEAAALEKQLLDLLTAHQKEMR